VLALENFTFSTITFDPRMLASWNNHHWIQLIETVLMSYRSCDSDHGITRSEDICVELLIGQDGHVS